MIYTEKDIEHMMSFYPKHLRHLYFQDHPKYVVKENDMIKESGKTDTKFKGILNEYKKSDQKLGLFSSKLTGNGHISENPMKHDLSSFIDDKPEMVNGPLHYGGKDNPYEAIKVIEAWDLGFNLGNTLKYISRAGRKDKDKHIQDLEKALFYLKREIENLKNG